MMPFGWMTLDGPKPEYKQEYGLIVHNSSSYVPRTRANVRNSDGTVRLAFDFDSRGEICTFKAIKDYEKPWIDVDLSEGTTKQTVDLVVEWLHRHNVQVLNIAGNAEKTWPGTYEATFQFLEALFRTLRKNDDG
jgi:hypothetical protein